MFKANVDVVTDASSWKTEREREREKGKILKPMFARKNAGNACLQMREIVFPLRCVVTRCSPLRRPLSHPASRHVPSRHAPSRHVPSRYVPSRHVPSRHVLNRYLTMICSTTSRLNGIVLLIVTALEYYCSSLFPSVCLSVCLSACLCLFTV